MKYGLCDSQSSFAKCVGMRESAVLAQWSLCQTGYKSAFLYGPGIAAIVLGMVMMAEGHLGTERAKPESCTSVCVCVFQKMDLTKNGKIYLDL